MTTEELAVTLDKLCCNCGQPEAAYAALLRLLRLHPLHQNRAGFEAWIPDRGLEMILLQLLDEMGLNEHGGNIGGAWLTPKGEAVREALEREHAADGFVSLAEPRCIHGYLFDDKDHEC